MIVVASDARESFDSIDKWARQIRNADQKIRPTCLLLVNKNEGDEMDKSKMLVTEEMVTKKSKQSGFEGAIMISNKAMTQSEYQQTMNQGIKKLIDKVFEKNFIGARGLLVYGMIHCKGLQNEKRAALKKVYEQTINLFDDNNVLLYEDFLRTIVCFSTKGEL